LTFEFTEELLQKARFREVRRVEYRETSSEFPEIVELDDRDGWNRAAESFYVEAVK
jgi:hypothetical protein